MTTDIATLSEALVSRPADIEHRLVSALRNVALRIAAKPEVTQALVAAEALPRGLVIGDDAKASEVVDLVKAVIAGEKVLALEEGLVLRIPRQMEQAVKDALAEARGKLKAAKETGNNARVAFQSELRRRAANEEAERRRAAAVAAQQATAEAEPFGGEEVPVADVAPVVVPRTVAGGAGKSGTQVRIEPEEIVDDVACPREWKLLAKAVARAVFLSDEMQGKVKRPAPGESIVYQGVRFASTEHAVNR